MLAQQIGFGLVCGAAAGRLAVWAMDRFSFQIEEGNTIFAVAAMLVELRAASGNWRKRLSGSVSRAALSWEIPGFRKNGI